MTQVLAEVEGMRTYVDFEVIDIVDDTNMYPSLLGIDQEIDNHTIINFQKMILTFEDLELRVVTTIDQV